MHLGIITVELILQERTVYQRYIVGPFPTIRIVESNQDWCCPFNYNAKKTQPGNHLRVCSIRLHFYFLSLKKNMKNSQYWSKYVFKNCIFPSVSNDTSSPPRCLQVVLAYNDVIFSAEKILMHISPSLYIVKSGNRQPEIHWK